MTLYKNPFPVRFLLTLSILAGIMALYISWHLFQNEIYIGGLNLILPLLGIALLSTGITKKQVRLIHWEKTKGLLYIEKQGIGGIYKKHLSIDTITFSLTSSKDKNSYFNRVKLSFLQNKKEIELLETNYLGIGKKRISETYRKLKTIKKETDR
jgi:hypothetical protein